MANLFEKPIAANPLSQFVELPLGFMNQLLDQRQQRYDTAKAAIDEQEDSLLNLKYLPGDRERHMQIQAGFESQLDEIVNSAGGDYSKVLPQLDRFNRRLKKEIAHGELGAQQSAFTSAAKFREDVESAYRKGDYSKEGYDMALQSIGSYRTTPTDAGGFNSFRGYTPSTVTNPHEAMIDISKKIVSKYNDAGMKYVDRNLILSNLDTELKNNSNLRRALQEQIYTQLGPNATPEQTVAFLNDLKESVVTSVRFEEQPKLKDASGNDRRALPAQVLYDWQQPTRMSGTGVNYTGGSVPVFRDLFKAIGANAWGDFENSLKDPKIQRRIKYIEQYKTNEKFPTTAREQADWLERHISQPKVGEIQTEEATPKDMSMIDAQGFFLNPGQVAVYNRQGQLLDDEEIAQIQGGTKSGSDTRVGNLVAKVIYKVKAGDGYPPGSLVMRGSDGEEYIVENKNPEVINTPAYNNSLLDMASKTNTGYLSNVVLRAPVDKIPAGTYDVEHIPTKNSYENYNIYQNGVLKYRKQRINGAVYTTKVE